MADSFEAAYRTRQTETQVRSVIGDIFEAVNQRPLCAYTLEAWAKEWLAQIKPEIDPKTYGRYSEVVASVKRLAPDLSGTAIDRIDFKAVLKFRDELLIVRAPSTANLTFKVMKSCCKMAWESGLVVSNPFARVKRVRIGDDVVQKEPFTAVQIQALLNVADDEWRGMILAGLYSGGQRLGDIATLTAGQVDLVSGSVRFTTDKTGRMMVVPVAAAWRKDLERRVTGRAPRAVLFPRAYEQYLGGGRRVGRISNSFRRLLARCKLGTKSNRARPGAVVGRRVTAEYSFHSFRHTATSMLKNAGVSDSVTRDIVGHDSVAISRVYTHIDDATKRAALAKLPQISWAPR